MSKNLQKLLLLLIAAAQAADALEVSGAVVGRHARPGAACEQGEVGLGEGALLSRHDGASAM